MSQKQLSLPDYISRDYGIGWALKEAALRHTHSPSTSDLALLINQNVLQPEVIMIKSYDSDPAEITEFALGRRNCNDRRATSTTSLESSLSSSPSVVLRPNL